MHRDHQGASNRRTATYLIRCLATAAVVIWLIVFAPLTCSYHGFLLRPGAMPVIADVPMGGMPMGGMHMRQGDQGAVTRPRDEFNPTLVGHHTSEGEAAMASLFIMATPAPYQLEPPAHSHARFVELPVAALHPWPPRERPPRAA
jgi:hypothetical protein